MKDRKMKINILQLIEGAKQAEGLTVIIDVFRAFSLECYLYDMGVKKIRPAGSIEDALELGKKIKDSLLIGERGGAKCEGFDFGNSPSTVDPEKVKGKTVIHTTSAGTQGIVNARKADEIITGSLVNAKAVAEYIKQKNPAVVSLVCMGNSGVSPAPEDTLCAEYIKSLLEGDEMADFAGRVKNLEFCGGEHFFDSTKKHIFPQRDFYCCTDFNRFDFVIQVDRDEKGFVTRKIDVNCKK